MSACLRARELQHAWSSLSFTIFHRLLKFMSIESVIPSNHLILCHPLLLPSVFPRIRVFSGELVLNIRRPKHWSFSTSPSDEYSGLISLGLTGLISMLSKGLSRVFSHTTVEKHQFFGLQPSFMVQLSYPYMTTGKSIALTIQIFVGKAMSLLYNTLSIFNTAFLPYNARKYRYASSSPKWYIHNDVRAKLLQSYPILCDPMDSNLSVFSVHGILQGRILEWFAMPSLGSSWPRDWTSISYISSIGRWVLYH